MPFDWVFQNNNCENLILYLVNHGDSSLFKTRVIKTFINLLWQKFQPIIARRVFSKYCMYLVVQMMMGSGFAGAYFRLL
jgi:hypothetical protein